MQNQTKRMSKWTAAGLVATVAVTTGYLAHAVPPTSSASGTSTSTGTKSPAVVPGGPAVHGSVVTSGGSGAPGSGSSAHGSWKDN